MKSRDVWSTGVIMTAATLLAAISPSLQAEESGLQAPRLKFFYYDSRDIEWVVSAEPEPFQEHLETNSDSARMFGSLTASTDQPADIDQVRVQMARWLENERERFGQPGGSNVSRFRRAEGIVAYLRAHDFSVDELVQELLRRAGASDVELVAVHLIDGAGNASFRLKVVLPDDEIGIGMQGFNVVLTSPEITYPSVVYALALALYEVHEIINSDLESDGTTDLDLEPLPLPEMGAPFDRGNPFATPEERDTIGESALSN